MCKPSYSSLSHFCRMTTLVLNPKKVKEENTIVKNWSKGTKPLVSLQASDTMMATYGSSESKPRARARATA